MKKFTFLVSFLFITSIGFSQDILMQTGTVNQCSGTFFDSGGAGNYSSNENFTLTICPDVAGNYVNVNFTSFDTQLTNDVLEIFNGPDITAPSFGTWSGGGAANNPGTVSATESNTSGCLTFVFTSDTVATSSGWEATISCFEYCQTIVSQIDTATPAANGDGYIRVCPNEDITLSGSGNFSADPTGATYEWDLGDGNTIAGQTATFSYPNPGVYIVNLDIRDDNTFNDPLGCPNTNLINQVIQVGTEPDFSGTQAIDTVICFGDSTTIDGVVTPTEFSSDCTPPVSGVTALPDGSGATYESTITVDCYDSELTVTDVNQIVSVCVNIEHSFSGDLGIFIISPNGQQTQLFNQEGGGVFFGDPIGADDGVPGIGAEYCFTPNATLTVNNGPTIIAGNPPGNSWAPGSYLPTGNFNALIGSPLNGDWTIQVIDNLIFDDGTIFSWSIEFDSNLLPLELSFTPTTVTEGWDPDPTITNATGNTITVAPPTAGEFCYTYRTTDDFGCEYTEIVCIDVLPEIVTNAPNNLFLCNSGTPPYSFDLTQNDVIINTPVTNPANQNITYYETQTDADDEINEIGSPTAYSSSAIFGVPQTIFVRVEYLTSGCYITDSFTLNITAQPIINPTIDIVLCDDVNNDNTESFDLESQNLIILGAQPASDYTVSYYASLADAVSSMNALVSPYNNISNPQPIFVRVQLNGDANCFNVTSDPLGEFDLIVTPSPEISALTSNTDICSGDDAVFTISGTANHIVDYNINNTGTQQVTLDAAGQAVFTFAAVTVNQVLTLEAVTNPTTTCIAPLTNTQTVVVNPNPTVTLTSNTNICSGTDAVFTLTGDPGNIVDYNINAGGTLQITIDSSGQALISVSGAIVDQTITLESIINPTTTCSSILTNTNTVTINANPFVTSLATNTDICSGSNAIFTINGTADDVIDYTINGGTTQQVTIDATGEAIVTITGATVDQTIVLQSITNPVTTCSTALTNTDTVFIQLNPTVTLTSNMSICPGDDAVFTIDGTPGVIVDYNINGGGTLQTTLDASGQSVINLTTPTVDQTLTLESLNNPISSCTGVLTESNTVTANSLPTVVPPTPLEVCDNGTPDGITEIGLTIKDNEISGDNPAYTVTYYFDQADADAQINALVIPYTNSTPNMQTIFVGVQDTNTGCYDTTTLDLVVEQAPIANTPTDLEYCDSDSDGFGVFTLTDAEAEITGGASGISVTYHETPTDAINNVNALTSPYNNIVVNTQTIYVRVESATIATDCATFVDLILVVNPEPQIIQDADLTPFEVCDDNTDGFATFDLPIKELEILNLLDADTTNDLDPALYNISYYLNMADAEAPNNAIASPSTYVNTTPNIENIWVRVESIFTSCYKIVALELIVNPLPVLVQPDPLTLCDDNNPGDEAEVFALEDANAQILNGQTGITLTYFNTQAGADTNDAATQIFSPYTNTVNPQTVYVRATNNNTSCVSAITLDLRVNPLPSPAVPAPLEVCDDDNDGFFDMFDLDSQSVAIINNEADITISYYETETDAMSMTNPLVSPYPNIVANLQTVYVLATNDTTGCTTIVTMELVVLPSPVIPITIDDYVVCDDDNDGVNQFDFDTEITPQILTSGQTAADFTLSYHISEADADSGTNPIVNTSNYTNTTNPQTIFIRLESNANGCVTTRSFVISVALPPEIDNTYDNELVQCDDLDANSMEANDGFTSFDLTVEDLEITGPVNVSWIVTYYETLADSQTDTNAIADPTAYINTMTGPQTLFVRVTDNDTGCFSFTTVTLRVLPNPSPSPDPEDLELCDAVEIVGPNDLLEVFDLTQNETFIINGEVGISASYYLSQNDAIAANNAIADPTMHINEDPATPGVAVTPQTIFVRLTNGTDPTGLNGTGCYSLVSFDLIVNALPDVSAVDDFTFCEANTDGIHDFDLDSKTLEILNEQSPTDFTVTYHEILTDAQDGINALSSPYTNTSNPQEIFVSITNTITDCNVITSFNLEVLEGASANQNLSPFEQCDDNVETDTDTTNDSTTFDLTSLNTMVLEDQDATDYSVSYYLNEMDAETGSNAITSPYQNVSNPQIIFIRVDSNNNSCFETTTVTLQVNPLPVVVLDDFYTICLNTNGSEVINPPTIATGLDPAIYTFEWSLDGTVITSENGASITPTVDGTYAVVVTHIETQCITSDSTTVNTSEPPLLTASITTLAFAGQNDILVTITNPNANTIYEYSLDGGAWQSSNTNITYTFTDVSSGEHTIRVRDTFGCGQNSISVFVIDYPLYFTPNGDTFNDTWNIIGLENQPDAKIYLFDRFGKLLKQLSPTGDGWDGTFNGKAMPGTDYWFTVEYREPLNNSIKTFRSHFSLKR